VPGLLILPSLFFTPQNVAKQKGYVRWQIGLEENWPEPRVVWGEIGEPVSPMDPLGSDSVLLTLAWAAAKTSDGEWQKTRPQIEIGADFTGADYKNGAAQFQGGIDNPRRITILPPGTMNRSERAEEWASAKTATEAS
jgi:hypothetical protein